VRPGLKVPFVHQLEFFNYSQPRFDCNVLLALGWRLFPLRDGAG
jgi:hypothetical protein